MATVNGRELCIAPRMEGGKNGSREEWGQGRHGRTGEDGRMHDNKEEGMKGGKKVVLHVI